MRMLTAPLSELAEIEEIYKMRNKNPGMLMISGCVSSQKTHLIYALGERIKYVVAVCASEEKAKKMYEEYRFLEENVYYYPAKDLLFYQADIQGKMLAKKRMEVIQQIAELQDKQRMVIITTLEAFMDYLPPLDELKKSVLCIQNADVVDFEELINHLVTIGYEREVQVDGPGQFAVRGGIVDIYPLTEEVPVRIEFWDDEVDSIRTFDIDSQRSIENLEFVSIYPASETGNKEDDIMFADYFAKDETLIFLDEPVRLLEHGKATEEELQIARENRIQIAKDKGVEGNLPEFYSVDDVVGKLNHFSMIGMVSIENKCKPFHIRGNWHIQTKSVNPYNNSFEMLTQDLKRLKRSGYRVVLISGSRTRAKRLAEDLRDYDLKSYYNDDMNRHVSEGEIMVCHGHVENGYEYPMIKFVVISETDIFGRQKKKKKRKTYEGQKIQSFSDIKPGDYVVHENHGLGIYKGIEKIEVDKVVKDYMKISYADGGNLYILATQMDLIQKYASADAKKPKLNKLGGQEWHRTKSRVRGAVQEIAKDLVELYATRQEKEGFVYEKDTVWQKEFEEMFPFEETEDQLLAIEATKRDMESTRIMDRLICGDVGFGKTEIAVRAAFKAVQENKQVVYLVPTTILAQQHYNTFVQRMKEFPVRVDLMCRFKTPTEQKKTIEDLKKGLVDIVVGTHRLLSQDVQFKDLGLLIVDEEQRFGVQHKEKIKKMKENVDVLTLTATPIPRTLHMSLIGIRDMSVLEEAPMDRMPIQTYVMEYDDEMVREAIERELSRQGQVYYVYNRVKDIDEMAAKIQSLVPNAVVAFAHGQMREHQLEKIMYEYINGEIDVLVSTTIIETGLDIPNANTIIIHDSDRMGLSQLYQLRGRVGRSNRMAYAFLLYRRDKLLKEVAEKRLAAIREFTDLGSGVKIAMKDLEIRGAGNLLGEAQHGHMEAVGYDLYCKMLNEAVKHLKGELPEEVYATTVEINIDAYIPASYIQNEYQKLDIYKRIASIETEEEQDDMLEELIDRFGEPPRKVQQLLSIARLKSAAHRANIISVEQKNDDFKFVMYEKARVDASKIPGLLKSYNGLLTFKIEANPYFLYKKRKKNKKEKDEEILLLVQKIVEDIQGLIEE